VSEADMQARWEAALGGRWRWVNGRRVRASASPHATPSEVLDSTLEGLEPVAVSQKLASIETPVDADASMACFIALYGGLPQDMKTVVAERLVGYLRERGKDNVAIHSYVNGAMGVTAHLSRTEMEQVSEQFMFVRAIESNAEVVTEADSWHPCANGSGCINMQFPERAERAGE
jgi:hypothetical protein